MGGTPKMAIPLKYMLIILGFIWRFTPQIIYSNWIFHPKKPMHSGVGPRGHLHIPPIHRIHLVKYYLFRIPKNPSLLGGFFRHPVLKNDGVQVKLG